MKNKKRVLVGYAALIACLIILLSCIFLGDAAVESWHIWRLRAGDVRERKVSAARLSRQMSARALSALIKSIQGDASREVRETAVIALIESMRGQGQRR